MATIFPNHFQGAGRVEGDVAFEANGLARILRDLVDDATSLRASIVGINAKLDADGGVTDTNYAALWNPAALLSIKG